MNTKIREFWKVSLVLTGPVNLRMKMPLSPRKIAVPLALGLALSGAGAGAQEQAETRIAVRYEVNVRGVTVMKVNYSVNIEGTSYKSSVQAKTTGFADWFTDYKMSMGSAGSLAASEFQPASFTRERKKKGKWKGAKTEWLGGSPKIDEEAGGEDFADMAQAVNGATLDPLSLLLRQSFIAGDSPCQGEHRVYDGRDVYDVALSAGDGAADGKLACRVRMSYVAGREVEIAKPKQAKPDNYDLTMRAVASAKLGRKIWIADKITGVASGQEFVAQATELSVQ